MYYAQQQQRYAVADEQQQRYAVADVLAATLASAT